MPACCRCTLFELGSENRPLVGLYPADLDYALPTIRVVGSFTARRISGHGEVINQSRVQGWQ